MRQFTLARAFCGSALLAWPASRRVATQVVAHARVVVRIFGEPRDRAGVRRILQDGLHVRAELAADDMRIRARSRRA